MLTNLRVNGKVYVEYTIREGEIFLPDSIYPVLFDEVEMFTLQYDCVGNEVYENDILFNGEDNEVIRIYFDSEDLAFKIETPILIGNEIYWERNPIYDALGDYDFDHDEYQVCCHLQEYTPSVHRKLTEL